MVQTMSDVMDATLHPSVTIVHASTPTVSKTDKMTDAEKKHLIELIDSLVMAAVPNASKVQKYGGTLYTLRPDEKEGQFCGIFAQKAHVHLAFSQGASLDDPDGVLLGGGKYRRHLNFYSLDEVDAKTVKRFCKASTKL